MSEETNTNPKLGKKSQSPIKLKNTDDKNFIVNKNMTEQVSNKSKIFLLNSKLTEEYQEEEELDGISIAYKEQNKIKLITLDLLLKKIVTENFIDKNPIQIFSFCQQCYCFLDKDIMFNKIFNCYNFYKEKKVPLSQIGNLIKFLNILVIEMYEYYTKISLDNPTLTLLKNFYNGVICEIIELINNETEKKQEEEGDGDTFKIDEFQNKLEEYNDDEEDTNEGPNTDVFRDRNSEFVVGENKDGINRERFGTIVGSREEGGRYSSYLDEKDDNLEKDMMARNTINLGVKKVEKEDKKKKKKEEKEEKKRKKAEEKKKKKKKKKKKGLNLHFFHLKKEKPVKVEDKKAKEEQEKEDELQEKLRQIQELKKSAIAASPEEEIINCLRNIIMLFSLEEPNKRDLNQAKKNVDFYKDIYKKIAEAIGKPLPEQKTRHAMAKSVTVGNITNKKHKLKLHENDGYFDVIDWDKKDIGEKLISISKHLINKVHRREIYKAVFLKKNKEQTSPNVMENIDKFNRLTFFIIQDILSYDFAKDRGKIMEKWIKIAEYCRERKDYNDCVAINSALNNYIITGLKKTNNELGKEKKELLKKISKFCRYQGNYKKLREDMKSLGPTEYYIPYLGMILKDLAFYEENSKYLVDDVLINFEKLENVQIAVSEFFNFKNINDKENYNIPEELNFFEKLEDLKEADLEKLANDLEPEFKLYTNKKREKRPTNIDIKYFADTNVKRPNMRDSKKLTQK